MKGNANIPSEHSVQSHFGAMHSPTKPWYFSTKAIVRVVEKAVNALPANQTDFDQAIFGINALSNLIKDRTEKGALVINLEETQELMDRLDGVRTEQFIQCNDGTNHQRETLATTLRELIAQIAEQQRLASEYLCQKSAEAQGADDRSAAVSATASPPTATSWLTATFILPVLSTIHNRFPGPYEKGIAVVDAGKRCTRAFAARVIERTVPIAGTALETAQPYLTKAQPILDPALARLQRLRTRLVANPILGPYVLYATQQLETLLSLASLPQLPIGPDLEAADLHGAVDGLQGLPSVSDSAAVDIDVPLPVQAPSAALQPPPVPTPPHAPVEGPPVPLAPVAQSSEPAATTASLQPPTPLPAAASGQAPAQASNADRLPSAPPPSPA